MAGAEGGAGLLLKPVGAEVRQPEVQAGSTGDVCLITPSIFCGFSSKKPTEKPNLKNKLRKFSLQITFSFLYSWAMLAELKVMCHSAPAGPGPVPVSGMGFCFPWQRGGSVSENHFHDWHRKEQKVLLTIFHFSFSP